MAYADVFETVALQTETQDREVRRFIYNQNCL